MSELKPVTPTKSRGRPKLAEEQKAVTIYLPDQLIEHLDYWCDFINAKDLGHKVSRAELIRVILAYRISNTPMIFREWLDQQRSL